MKELILMLVLGMPLMSAAVNEKPVKSVFKEWASNNIIYPNQAIENKEEGIVYVSFTISENGEVENIRVEEGVSESLNAEAMAAVSNMPLSSMNVEGATDKAFIIPIKFMLK